MTSRVTQTNEVFLNTKRFKLVEGTGVTSSVISDYPEKLILGDFSKDSHKNISVFTWNDQRGGGGVHRMTLDQGDRCEETGFDISHKGHLTLSGLTATLTAQAANPPVISQLGSNIVAASDTAVEDFDGTSWTSRHTLTDSPTDVRNGNLAGTEFLVFCYTSGYAYSSSIATWAASTKDALKLEFWHNRFWGIDATGQLWYTYTMGSAEVNDARVLLDLGEVITGLLVGRAPNQEFILYAVTSKRILAHDMGNRRFVPITGITIADNNVRPYGRPAAVWRERIYIAAERSIIEYDPVASTVRDVGFDLDDGLVSGKDGRVSCLAPGVRELFAGTRELGGSDSPVVMGWNGRGWRQLRQEPSGVAIESMHVGTNLSGFTGAASKDNIFWGNNDRVRRQQLNHSAMRPANISGFQFGDGGANNRHVYPVFDGGQYDVTKVLLRLKVEVAVASATNAVKIFIKFDGASETQMTSTFTSDSTFSAGNGQIEGNGITTFSFPSVAAPAGTSFRDLQVILEGNIASGTGSFDVLSVTLEYFKVLDTKLGFDFSLDLNQDYSNQSPLQQRAALVTASKSAILVEFTFRDDDATPRNYYVNVKQVSGMEESGHDESGIVRLHLEEP